MPTITCPEAYETAPGADVCLDFSGVGALKPLLGYLRRTKTALVSGTTGLTEPDLDALHELGRELPVIWTANYSTASPCSAGCCMIMRAFLLAGTRRSWKSTTTRRPTRRAARAKLLLQELDPEGTATVLHGREGLLRQAQAGGDRRVLAARRNGRGRAYRLFLRRG